MTKKSMFILSFLALAMTASAQIDKGDDGFGQRTTRQNAVKKEGKKLTIQGKHYNYELSLGFRAGAGVSTMSESEDLKIYDGSGIGFGGGIAANLRFGSKDSRGRYLDGQDRKSVGRERVC